VRGILLWMELRQLRHFVAVAEAGNFSEAARRVFLSQPALTRSIKTLEDHLETRLLERGPQGASLTRSGELFLEYARMILNDCDRAQREIRMFREGVAGHVSMGIAALFAGWIADEAVQRATAQLPNVELTVTEGYFEDLLGLLRIGKLDFALTNFAQPGIDAEFVVEPILDLHARMIAASHHPLAGKSPILPQDLAQADWVTINKAHSLDILMKFFGNFDLPPPRALRTNSLALLKAVVANGSHLTLVSHAVMHRELQRGQVRILDVAMPEVTREAGLIYLRQRPRNSAVERMMQIVREAGRDDPRGARSATAP
jgi:DNA-binding transcriptional LysR family regulator